MSEIKGQNNITSMAFHLRQKTTILQEMEKTTNDWVVLSLDDYFEKELYKKS